MGGMREEDVVFCSVQLSLSAQATDQQWHIIADSSHQAALMMIFSAGFLETQLFYDFKAKNPHWRFITTVSYKPAATTAGSDRRFTLFRAQYNWVIWKKNPNHSKFQTSWKKAPVEVTCRDDGTGWNHRSVLLTLPSTNSDGIVSVKIFPSFQKTALFF